MLSRILAVTLATTKKIQYSQLRIIYTPMRYSFTSSSDPTQVALLQQVEAKIFQVLKTAAKCNQAKLNRTANFQQLGFDSLDSVQLVVAMQQYFGFDIPNEEAQKILTVQAAINTFYRHLNARIANKIIQNSNPSDLKGTQ